MCGGMRDGEVGNSVAVVVHEARGPNEIYFAAEAEAGPGGGRPLTSSAKETRVRAGSHGKTDRPG